MPKTPVASTGAKASDAEAKKSDITWLMPIRRALYDGVPLSVLMSRSEAKDVSTRLIRGEHFLEAKEVVRQFALMEYLLVVRLRPLYRWARRAGYIGFASAVMDEIAFRTGKEKDQQTALLARSHFQFARDPWSVLAPLPSDNFFDAQGPVVHMVGKSMPDTQTGYTLRTKYTLEALRKEGIESILAVQAGGNTEIEVPETLTKMVEGTEIVLFGGPSRIGQRREEWLQHNVDELYQLVQEKQPRALHAHSNFVNGVIATYVGEAAGIPVVYESRGFWEESWLSRTANALGWSDVEQLLRMYGVPEGYQFQRDNERRVRSRAAHVLTLARTMRDHILTENADELSAENVSLVSNAVNGADFPQPAQVSPVRAELGIGEDEVVIGYISSIVEYEGIETLIDAYAAASKRLSAEGKKARLLLVGDGNRLDALKRHVSRYQVEGVIFTGRVPHEEVLDYYHAIDVFVVPRRRSQVTELVTPLKPFEAFATGRAVVVSDVKALKEIAEDSGGAARIFPADDVPALSEILVELVKDPEERKAMGEQGAGWVRRERSWDSNVPIYREVYGRVLR